MNVLIVGCGRLGSRLAATLVRRGDAVTVVDPDGAALDRLGPHLDVRRIAGDGGAREVLIAAGVERVDGLAAVTGSDDLNAVLGRLASTVFSVPRVVARIFDPVTAEVYRRLGVQTIAPVTWGAQRLAELLTLSELGPVASLGDGAVELVDVRVPALLEGHPASELHIPDETQLVALTRDGATSLCTSGGVLLRAGDVVHLAVTSTRRLEALLDGSARR
jgi:trk system potassium uptake protein